MIMGEGLKKKLLLILASLCVFLFLVSIKSCGNAGRQKSARDREMRTRLDLEEKVSGIYREKAVFAEKLKAKERELAEEGATRQAVQKALTQEQSISQDLKNELSKMTDEKGALEDELKGYRALEKTKKDKK